MPMTMWEQCRMIKLTSAQFEEGMKEGWPHEEPGTAIVQMTAALAKLIASRYSKNRPIKPFNKQKILAALREKYWRLNGEPLILTREFLTLDGHHRLEAFAEMDPKETIEVVISWGWDADCFDTIDIGTKRSGGDVYHADGETQSVLLSAAARYDWRIVHKDMLSGNQLPEPLMRQYRDDNPGLKMSLSWAEKIWHLVPKGMAVALFYRFSQTDAPMAKQFFIELGAGEDINRGDYTWHLRQWLGTRKKTRLQLDMSEQAQIAATLIKSWLATVERQKAGKHSIPNLNQIVWRQTRKDEPFPDIGRCDQQNDKQTT